MAWKPDYCTPDELKAYRRIDDTVDDDQITLAITAASRAIDEHCNRQFGTVSAAAARYYTARWSRTYCDYVVEIDDLQSMSQFAIAHDSDASGAYATAITGYTLLPRNAASLGEVWTEIRLHNAGSSAEEAIQVTAKWGWTNVPDPVKQAALMQASRVFSRRESPYGVAGSPQTGSEVRLMAKVDPDVKVVLAPFKRWWGVV